ncbi:hypothetical protein K227x_50960 [Rubripirellula lacrimiformis]|uniref:Uncharacterized protein n=1 Tax=Rubripirellula lacrimiformis TaxID=1930273 RepID=A0A517NHS1_9BACT|nr:hypothetical protein [Rubripirellula lacrimiformis]QDT06680.1 hypothetical protein K227x_50960 [Rubripirellula lacrimiformis]
MSSSPDPFEVHSPAPVAGQPVADNPYAPTTHVSDEMLATDDVEGFRKKHLNHEASVRSVGLLYMLGACVMVPIGAIVMLGVFVGDQPPQDSAVQGGIGAIYLGFGVLNGFIGWGLRKLRPWTRIAAIIFSAIGLIGFPIGTLISAYILYLLLSEKGKVVFSPYYQDVIQQTPHIKYKTSIVVWVLLGLVLLLIILGVGFAVVGG